ncbi:hypothetical protein, partial [Mesorhizobium sp. M1A.F.Ca.ET.072.01.1.1]|uniref:hypothetical protein n=1 Tax=Mesorhizobium sp. M1A.F.Ca.ET.072.01.1.1 TaxID=2496753 RepID=UPI001AED0D9C
MDELLVQRAELFAVSVPQHHLAHRLFAFLLGILPNRIYHRLGQGGGVAIEQHDRQIVAFVRLELEIDLREVGNLPGG